MSPDDDKDDAGAERRIHARFETRIDVDYGSGDNFLFSRISNISEMGIFILTQDPLEIGSMIELRFAHDDVRLELQGQVVWINPVRQDGDNINPGMGVQFIDLTPELREEVVDLVHTIAYLTDEDQN